MHFLRLSLADVANLSGLVKENNINYIFISPVIETKVEY